MARADLQSPGRKPALHLALADYHARIGRRDEAVEQLRQVGIDPHDPTRPTDPHLIFSAALVYHQLGDREAALAWLERAVYWGVPPAELQAFPELDDLRSDPAFQGLVRQNGRRGP